MSMWSYELSARLQFDDKGKPETFIDVVVSDLTGEVVHGLLSPDDTLQVICDLTAALDEAATLLARALMDQQT